jgi:hypothetical protein
MNKQAKLMWAKPRCSARSHGWTRCEGEIKGEGDEHEKHKEYEDMNSHH